MSSRRLRLGVAVLVIAAGGTAGLHGQSQPAASRYTTPPQVIVDILDAPPLPAVVVSPDRQTLALLDHLSMPTIAELAQPMLQLAGTRINPRTNGPQRAPLTTGIRLKNIRTGAERVVSVPPGARIGHARFSPDGAWLAFTNARDHGIELWIANPASGEARALTPPALNATGGDPCDWLDEASTLLCAFVPEGRGAPPQPPDVPLGPTIQENLGQTAPVRTYQDLLQGPHDEALYEYYFTAQLAFVDPASGRRTAVGRPAIFDRVSASPNGEYILAARIKRPFSYLVPASRFPKDVEVWSRTGELAKTIADLPVGDIIPIDGVLTGPRNWRWSPADPATLVWAEALDEGDPRKQVPRRDRIVILRAPFTADPVEVLRTEYRFSGIAWTEQGDALVSEYDRPKRWRRAWLLDTLPGQARKLWDLSAEDRYADPGRPLERPGRDVILQHGTAIYLTGTGGSPEGDRPFLDRLDLKTLATERIFRSNTGSNETVLTVLTDEATELLTRHETKSDPPNYFVLDPRTRGRRAVTAFTDPAPQLRGVETHFVTYERKDGVTLSGTIYIPPGRRPGERLPMLVWAYPREFTDPGAASQAVGSPHRFTTVSGASHLLLLTQGYAIFDGPTMPIVGPGETANDTYVEQLVASAQAAVDKAVEMGIADRDRIGVGGHSYGAFMTANLLAHSDIFRAGIARSGAYNRSLTPFGFQNEIRTFWEVPHIYARMSPFWYAHQINEPVLLVHGEKDNNSGTFPIQSERLYMALKGHGATVRYVTLPHESHGYAARESVLHVVAEMLAWMDRHVKGAGPRTTSSQ